MKADPSPDRDPMRRLASQGVDLKPFSREILEACFKASQELYAELSEKSPHFKHVYANWSKFRHEAHLWFSINETGMDTFMQAAVGGRAEIRRPRSRPAMPRETNVRSKKEPFR